MTSIPWPERWIQAQIHQGRKGDRFVGRGLVNMIQAHDQGGPNHGMERYVVFTKEIEVPWHGAILCNRPPALPCIVAVRQIVGVPLRPYSCAGRISLHGFKPHIDALSVPGITFQWNGDTPFKSRSGRGEVPCRATAWSSPERWISKSGCEDACCSSVCWNRSSR